MIFFSLLLPPSLLEKRVESGDVDRPELPFPGRRLHLGVGGHRGRGGRAGPLRPGGGDAIASGSTRGRHLVVWWQVGGKNGERHAPDQTKMANAARQ